MIYLLSIVIDLVFAIWAGIGEPWHRYLLNFVLLFVASSAINTSYIQGLTRGNSFIYLYGIKGIPKMLSINVPTVLLTLFAFFITRYVFTEVLQYVLFFIACIVLSTIVAFIDNQFEVAIERTKAFEAMKQDKKEK